jgi:integrase
MKQTKLSPPRRVNINGKSFWQVTTPAPGGGRTRKTFKDREDARIFFERSKVQLAQFGQAAMIDDRTRTDAARAREILQGTGKSIVDAARFLREHLSKVEGGMPLKKAVADFLAQKKAEGTSERHQVDLRTRLARFLASLAESMTTAQVQTSHVDSFLAGLGLSAQTGTGYRTILHTFFSWCESRGLSVENPVSDAMRFKIVPAAPGILSPTDAANLLASCDDAILPGVVMGMFCGLRQAEIARLDWRHVDLAGKIITVGADVAKTSSRRTVEIPENAVQWLSPLAKSSGRIWPEGEEARNLWNLARIKAGFGPFFSTRAIVKAAQTDPATGRPRKGLRDWPDNALRHSAISYRLAKTRDLPRVATEAGNSPGIVQRHYAEIVKPDAAAKFFSILPESAQNVTTFPSKAA